MRRYFLATVILCAGAVSGCEERNTTAPDLGFILVNPRTVEVLIPFEDFVDDVQVFGGYGSSADLRLQPVALNFNGLEARTLVHVSDFPDSAQVRDDTGTLVMDDDLSFKGGHVVLVFDTVQGSLNLPVNLELFNVNEEWHPASVNWEMAVDTAGDQRPWIQAGGGSLTSIGTGIFDATILRISQENPPYVDTVSIAIDSAAVAALVDPTTGARGILIAGVDAETILYVVDMRLRLTTVPSIRPDTVLELEVEMKDISFMLDPTPAAPAGWLRVGGVPAWRSVLTLSIPRTVAGTVEVCGSVGCEVDLTEVALNLAELVLTTRETETAYQPLDTSRIDLRRVLNPELLPKSPLSGKELPVLENLAPELFSVDAGTLVLFGMTDFVDEILLNAGETGTMPVTTIVLFNAFEPDMIGFASFEGGGGAGAPVLRLLYTVANEVGLP